MGSKALIVAKRNAGVVMAMAVGEYRRGGINSMELLNTLPTKAGYLFNITITFPFPFLGKPHLYQTQRRHPKGRGLTKAERVNFFPSVIRNSAELEKSSGKKFPAIKQCLSAFPKRRGRR